MKNVYFFLSNRCSYERARVLLYELEEEKEIQLTLLIGGGLVDEEFSDLRSDIHSRFNAIELDHGRADGTLQGMATVGTRIGRRVNDMFSRLRPDLLVLWADRHELLPVAMVAAYLQIPICHIQGGEDSGNIDQRVRHAVSMMSDLHMVSHDEAYKKLVSFGLNNVHQTGCPSLDVIDRLGIKRAKVLNDTVICLYHPHTN